MIYIALAVIALIAGIVTAIAGGGGMLVVSALMLTDMPIKLILGTNRVSAFMDNSTSSYNYYKKGKVNKEFLKYSIIPGLIGTTLGAKLLLIMNPDVLERLIPVALIAIVIYTLTSKKKGEVSYFNGFTKKNIVQIIILSLVIGTYLGFFGMAAGSMLALLLVFLFKFDFLEAVATSKPLLAILGFYSIIILTMNGLVDYRYALFITVFRVLGSKLGSNYATKKGAKLVKPVFLALCTIIAIKNLAF